jgi:predicted dehydrogenase
MTGAGIWMADRSLANGFQTPNEKINFACIGVGGKGSSDTMDASRYGNIVALCDVDEKRLAEMAQRFPNAKKFSDYRKMLDTMGKEIDAVTVSTPDHSHAPAASMAMLLGKHCFCQKPLTHALYEAHRLGEIAKKMKVATQMGNQGTSGNGLRKAAAQLQKGIIGTPKELHVWTNRPIWPQGGARPEPKTPPSHLDFDLWLGPAPERPYGEGYHPFAWRGYWDFGTGALGDMACHTLNMPFMGLDLRNPISVEAQCGGHNGDSYPNGAIIKYEFAATANRPALTMHWYEGNKMPSQDVLTVDRPSDSGSLIIGDKGVMYTPGDYGQDAQIISGGVDIGEVQYVQSPGHMAEFANAIKGQAPAMSNFQGYAVPLTEVVLLGNLAVWACKDGQSRKVEWDAKKMKAKGMPELDAFIRPKYRKGYKLG